MDSKYIDIIYKELSARMTYGLKVQVLDSPDAYGNYIEKYQPVIDAYEDWKTKQR